MQTPSTDIIGIRAEINRELNSDPAIGVARVYMVRYIMHRINCSEYAVMKQLNSLERAGVIHSEKYNNKVFLFRNKKG